MTFETSHTDTISGVTDTGSNTWTAHVNQVGGAGSDGRMYVYSAHMTTGLVSGNTISITITGSTSNALVWNIEEFSGIVTGTTVDASDSQVNTASSTPSSPAVSQTAGGGRLVLGVVGGGSNNNTLTTQDSDTSGGVAWSTLNSNSSSGGSGGSNAWSFDAYKIVATGTTAHTYNPTVGSSIVSQGAVVIFQESGGGGATVIPNLVMAPYRGAI